MADTHILVADDDAATRSAVAWLLKEQGWGATAICAADDVVEQLARRRHDLLIIDAGGPGEAGLPSGLATLQRLRNDERWRDLPIVVLAAGGDDLAGQSFRLGASDFVSKPLRLKELLARVEAQLRFGATLRHARETLNASNEALLDAREEARSRRELVDILHEVAGELSPEEIFRILARRVASAQRLALLGDPGAAR